MNQSLSNNQHNAERVYRICKQCAETVYDQRQPTPTYALSTAYLLFGTAAQESCLQWERQRTPRWVGKVGGFSKWQLETGSIEASIKMLKSRPQLLVRATEFVFADPNTPLEWPDLIDLDAILWALRMDDNDKLGCMFSRLHYMRVPTPIPHTIGGQAQYWKEHYNTLAGKGTANQYVASWTRYCSHVVVDRTIAA